MTKERAEALKEIHVARYEALVKIMEIVEPLMAFEQDAEEGDAEESLTWLVEQMQEAD